MINKDININKLIFLLIILLASVFCFVGFEGLFFSDDYIYSFYAHQLSECYLNASEDIFFHRIGVYLPVSILYSLFGVNDFTTFIWPFLCFIGTSVLIYKFLYPFNKVAALAGTMLWTLGFYPLYFSNKLFPDIILAFFTLASLIVLYGRAEGNKIWKGVLFALSVFYCFLVKETIIYVFPFFLFLFINDLLKRRFKEFWITAIAGGILLFGMYLLFYQIKFDDPLYRFKIVQEGHYISSGSYYDKPFESLFRRLTYGPFKLLLASEMIIPIAFAFMGIRTKWKNDTFKFWFICGCFVLVAFWIGSTSLKFYNPISLNPRMYLMLFPIWAIVGGWGVAAILQMEVKSIIICMLFFVLFALIEWLIIGIPKQSIIYVLLSLLMICFIGLRYFNFSNEVFYVLFAVIFFIHPLYSYQFTSRRVSYLGTKKIIQNNLPSIHADIKIISDPLISVGYNYFYEFKPNGNIHFIKYKDLDSINKIMGSCYALINKKHIEELQVYGIHVPKSFISPPENWKLIQSENGVLLYFITDCDSTKQFK